MSVRPNMDEFAACDCHVHIIGNAAQYPKSTGRDYSPPEASPASYKKLAAEMKLRRAVIIQPSVYGTDNSCTSDAIIRSNGWWRGIAVVSPNVSPLELQQLHNDGFRGIRLNLLHGDDAILERLEDICTSIAPMGWHVELAIRPKQLGEIARRLTGLPVDFVIDHMARLPLPCSESELRSVNSLLRSGKCWVKLSGAYIISSVRRPYDDVALLAKNLIKERADRMLWGTNWPHPRRILSTKENLELLELLFYWCGDAEIARSVLHDNPALLYGFPRAC